jgi:hypothetical protein
VTYDSTIIAHCAVLPLLLPEGREAPVRPFEPLRLLVRFPSGAFSSAIWPALHMLPRYVVGTVGAHTHEHGVGDNEKDPIYRHTDSTEMHDI